jgi:predicted transcriptional regulator
MASYAPLKRKALRSKAINNELHPKALLKWHRMHHGIYARVARRLEVDPSFVSRVANGERNSGSIEHALVSEIVRIHRMWPGA